jgi:hypothetical protein
LNVDCPIIQAVNEALIGEKKPIDIVRGLVRLLENVPWFCGYFDLSPPPPPPPPPPKKKKNNNSWHYLLAMNIYSLMGSNNGNNLLLPPNDGTSQ